VFQDVMPTFAAEGGGKNKNYLRLLKTGELGTGIFRRVAVLKVHYHFHKSLSLDPFLSQMNPVLTIPSSHRIGPSSLSNITLAIIHSRPTKPSI
jgi:hypothetical protein